MRPSQKQNRPRGRGGRKPSGNNINRVYESAGPEGKVRGTPQQIVDKYLSLARDAQTSGDRVVAENFLQHAEHYQRIVLEAMGARAEQRGHPSEQDQPDYDGDDGSDGEIEAAPMAVVEVQNRRQGGNGQQREERRQRPAEVSGLTTIDADEPDNSNLLVDADEMSGGGSRRPRRRRGGGQPAEGAAAPEAGAEAATE